ncbi:MAG: hypothetical protein KF746_08275 [Chitinophagaceae bacterium]|nr:hypothetical protein [Chitinophagaceae bacterium]
MNIEATIEACAHQFLQGLKTEYDGDKEALLIIRQFIASGKITAQQEHLLKTQLADSLKILGVGIPLVLIPGASILMPILIKVAAKHNIELMPSAFTDLDNSSGKQ